MTIVTSYMSYKYPQLVKVNLIKAIKEKIKFKASAHFELLIPH